MFTGSQAATPFHNLTNEHVLREQVEPLLLGDGLLSEQLENDGSHQIPLVLKLQGAFVLEEEENEREVRSVLGEKTRCCFKPLSPFLTLNLNNN